MFFSKNHRWIYLPVEIKAREYDAKVLLSYLAAKRGFGVLVGGQHQLQRAISKTMKGGVYLDKSITGNKKKFLNKLANKQITVACFDEEGLLQSRDMPERAKRYATRRLSGENLAKTDLFFCWGQNQAGIIEDFYPEHKHRIRATGGPRIDLVRPELNDLYAQRMKDMAAKYAPYIFIPSTFSTYINATSPDFVLQQVKRYDALSGNKETNRNEYEFYQRKIEFVRQNFEHFKEAITKLAPEYKNYNFVIRPHPQDDFSVWHDFAKDIDNVHVVFEGTAVQWISACEVMVHNNCTTGIEGVIMGGPVIHYTPVEDDEQDRNIAGAETLKVKTLDELKNAMSDILSGKEKNHSNEKALEALSPYISSLKGPLASEKILDELEKLHLQEKKLPLGYVAFKSSLLIFLHNIRRALITLKMKLLNKENPGDMLSSAVEKQKFPGVTKTELIESYQEIAHLLKDDTNMKVKQIAKDFFYVYADSKD